MEKNKQDSKGDTALSDFPQAHVKHFQVGEATVGSHAQPLVSFRLPRWLLEFKSVCKLIHPELIAPLHSPPPKSTFQKGFCLFSSLLKI